MRAPSVIPPPGYTRIYGAGGRAVSRDSHAPFPGCYTGFKPPFNHTVKESVWGRTRSIRPPSETFTVDALYAVPESTTKDHVHAETNASDTLLAGQRSFVQEPIFVFITGRPSTIPPTSRRPHRPSTSHVSRRGTHAFDSDSGLGKKGSNAPNNWCFDCWTPGCALRSCPNPTDYPLIGCSLDGCFLS